MLFYDTLLHLCLVSFSFPRALALVPLVFSFIPSFLASLVLSHSFALQEFRENFDTKIVSLSYISIKTRLLTPLQCKASVPNFVSFLYKHNSLLLFNVAFLLLWFDFTSRLYSTYFVSFHRGFRKKFSVLLKTLWRINEKSV